VRTDLDHFSDLEISGLVQHGYCVARKACRSRPDLFGEELPKDYPWDPIPKTDGAAVTQPSATGFARLLRWLAPGERNGDKCAPAKPWTGELAEEIGEIDEPDLKGFHILQDSHILDLRKWTPANAGKTGDGNFLYGFRRLKVWRLRKETGNNLFRIRLLPTNPLTQVRFPPQELQPKLRVHREENGATGAKHCRWEMSVDCERVAPGDLVEILEEHLSPGDFVHDNGGSAILTFEPLAKTAELTRWILMPEGREYKSHRLLRYEKGKTDTKEVFKFAT